MENFENENEIIETDEIEESEPSFDWKRELWDWVKAIGIALVISFLLKNFVLTLAKVDGVSMEPTLQNSDRMYVNRLMYTPEKGDVIIFEPASDPGRPYIKRVIATEGDSLFINFLTGDVFVNGKIIDEPYIAEKTSLVGSYIYDLMSQGKFTYDNPLVIGKDEIFVMGDNRNHSKDSREIGPVPTDEIIGHAVFRFWPLNNMGSTDFNYIEESEVEYGDSMVPGAYGKNQEAYNREHQTC